MKKRFLSVILLSAATAAVCVAAYAADIDPPLINVLCAFATIAAFYIVSLWLNFSNGLFISGLAFIFMASPLGSVLNLYRTVDSYDKVVHFISGIVLAALGMTVARRVFSPLIKRENEKAFSWPLNFTAFLFSGAAAGFWEIFEFFADKAAGGTMQRGMVDTVTDMIAGFSGALVYSAVVFIHNKKIKKN